MADPNTQDWTPIVFRKQVKSTTTKNPIPGETVSEQKFNAGKNTQKPVNSSARKIEKIADGDEDVVMKSNTVSPDLKLQIQQARQAKKLTQKQLATSCNLPESVIKSYENGTAQANGQELAKMSRILGVKLKK